METQLQGDLNGNATLDAADIDRITWAAKSTINAPGFDLNGDGEINGLDRHFMIEGVIKTWIGDSNLDGEFNSTDFVQVFQAGEYEDDLVGNSTWSTGDWNGDGDFDSSDFVVAFQEGGYEKGPRVATASVPEPNGVAAMLICGSLALGRIRAKKR